ncbi:MAG TPA: hypothetical protein VK970_02115 [Candidatus Methylacidiphilales bacterium]|nr:hypothetical protein [Candidatus Methylacidiphilales bacterium]
MTFPESEVGGVEKGELVDAGRSPAATADHNPLHCPAPQPLRQPPYPMAELDPLLEYLASGRTDSRAVTFPRGTVQPDGRLDLCKQSLGVEGCRRVIGALRGNTAIRSLMLGTDAIGDEGAQSVAEIVAHTPNLATLYLGCNAIGPGGVEHLASAIEKSPHVKALWLKRNPIGPEGAIRLAALIRRAPHLRVLDLVHTRLDVAALRHLTAAMLESDHIERLYLGGNALPPEAAEPLAKLLARSTALQALFLNVNALGDTGCELLARGVIHGDRRLRELGLGSNGLTPRSAPALAEMLSASLPGTTSLQEQQTPAPGTGPGCGFGLMEALDLGISASTRALCATPNHLGDTGAAQLAQALPGAPALRWLSLEKTGIGSAGKNALAAAIPGTSLVDLKLETPGPALSAALSTQRKRLGSGTGTGSVCSAAASSSVTATASIRSVYR